MDTIKGRSLELYFIDGKPDGMLTATVPFQWTGHVLMANRNQISDALKRKEASRTGVYLLFGETEDGTQAYIGEGEDISQRIKDHAGNKDWWTSAILITDTGNELNKAHVKYLEARLVETALDVGKIQLENNTTPTPPSLSEAATANMEGFLDNIFTVLPALRIDSFLKETRSSTTLEQNLAKAPEKPIFTLKTPKHGIYAEATLEGGEFVVLKGAKGNKKWMNPKYQTSSEAKKFHELIKLGLLIEEGNNHILVENYAFSSPSTAAAVLNGRSTNGRTEWKLKGTKKTYREWEAEQLAASDSE